MSTYVIGDIQGCYDPLMRLLEMCNFDDKEDQLWLVGDLVNRGPQSLEVLRFLKNLRSTPVITLGNHDLHLLARIFTSDPWIGKDDTLQAILEAPDAKEIGHWLRKQKILHYDAQWDTVMVHAGIAPCWDLEQAIAMADELQTALQGNDFIYFLQHLYGNEPQVWSEQLSGIARLRMITNYFTRMRLCDEDGRLLLEYKENTARTPQGFYPWFSTPNRKSIAATILFGHWAALRGKCAVPRIYALDTGCLWGGALTALRLDDKKKYSLPCNIPLHLGG